MRLCVSRKPWQIERLPPAEHLTRHATRPVQRGSGPETMEGPSGLLSPRGEAPASSRADISSWSGSGRASLRLSPLPCPHAPCAPMPRRCRSTAAKFQTPSGYGVGAASASLQRGGAAVALLRGLAMLLRETLLVRRPPSPPSFAPRPGGEPADIDRRSRRAVEHECCGRGLPDSPR